MSGGGDLIGKTVSKAEVIASLGTPSAQWERDARRLELEKRLANGQTELDIAGIRGYAGQQGYLGYLEQSLVKPLGTDTSLVSDEENALILGELTPEIQTEIERYRARLAELEDSPAAVAEYIGRMRWWLDYLMKTVPGDPDKEDDEMLRDLAQETKAVHEKEIAILTADIERYQRLLQAIGHG